MVATYSRNGWQVCRGFCRSKIKQYESGIKVQKEILDNLKEHLFNNIKPSQVEDNYYNLLDKIAIHIGLK